MLIAILDAHEMIDTWTQRADQMRQIDHNNTHIAIKATNDTETRQQATVGAGSV